MMNQINFKFLDQTIHFHPPHHHNHQDLNQYLHHFPNPIKSIFSFLLHHYHHQLYSFLHLLFPKILLPSLNFLNLQFTLQFLPLDWLFCQLFLHQSHFLITFNLSFLFTSIQLKYHFFMLQNLCFYKYFQKFIHQMYSFH